MLGWTIQLRLNHRLSIPDHVESLARISVFALSVGIRNTQSVFDIVATGEGNRRDGS